MKTHLKKLSNLSLDILFPLHCLGCQTEGVWICDACLAKIPIATEYVCPICEKKIVPDGRTCHNCKKKNTLDALVPATTYRTACVAKAVHLFKYRFVADLHVPLANLLISALQKTELPLPEIIIPIPLHPRRLRWRGFNQSLLLAEHLAKNLLPVNELPVAQNVLVRNRYTFAQMEIKDYQGRKQNTLGAFSLTNTGLIKNKTILLVDDITTTGATIFECAKILKAAGANQVFACVIARQETLI